MADKLAQHILDALSKAAAEPGGLPLVGNKSEPGLFPSTAAAKSAAQKAIADGLLQATGAEANGKPGRECYILSEAGWDYLLDAVNPKQVLEDFVRVLEARQGEVGELLDSARQMAELLNGIRDAVSRVIPRVMAGRLVASADNNMESIVPARSSSFNGSGAGTAVLETLVAGDLAAGILTRLDDWSSQANAGEDCPLPTLFRSLAAGSAATIGEFHDALRRLHADGLIYLHPWTGPLHEMPEPAYALLIGHNIAYYASLREAGARNQEPGVRRTGS